MSWVGVMCESLGRRGSVRLLYHLLNDIRRRRGARSACFGARSLAKNPIFAALIGENARDRAPRQRPKIKRHKEQRLRSIRNFLDQLEEGLGF